MRKRTIASIGIVALILSLAMLHFTTPQMVGPLGVLAFFIFVYIFFAFSVYILLSTLVVIGRRRVGGGKWQVKLDGLSGKRLYYYSSFIALAPVILLGMQSVGPVRLVDMVLILLFQLLGIFYVSRRF